MRDFAVSDSPAVQTQLDRLDALSLPQGRLGLGPVRELLARLDNPHESLPPVFHVAGTNGKGSTCAFLRAMLEAAGLRVHATISPHLVRYNERIRIAGELVSDDELTALLAEVLDASEDLGPSFFEVTIAASFLAFARHPADACVIEVGLGGRFDATNVIERPVACGIAALGIDHERFLLAPEAGAPDAPIARIAWEKAGIAKPGVPLATLCYADVARDAIAAHAEKVGALLRDEGHWWHHGEGADGGIAYRDAMGTLNLPPPALPGLHQHANCALAVAMIRYQDRVDVPLAALQRGAQEARWAARLQRMPAGPLIGARDVWLDGGHNRNAGEALARHFGRGRFHLVIGMIAGKDPAALVVPLADNIASLIAVPVPGHDWLPASDFGPGARTAPDVAAALAMLPDDGLPVLIGGSLYLAGEVLRANGTFPD